MTYTEDYYKAEFKRPAWYKRTYRKLFRDEFGVSIFGIFFYMGLALVLVVGLIFTISYHIDSRSCERYGNRMEREVIYDFWGAGCYVQLDDGTFTPKSNVIFTDEQEGVR